MKPLISALLAGWLLAGCAFHAPDAPVPPDNPRLPVNATAPNPKGY